MSSSSNNLDLFLFLGHEKN
uniref:Uncharacterized protein n=1 Tax=Rhizophora mucronata TaxID=61149 RepID=A0A2P2LV64_RHIMU